MQYALLAYAPAEDTDRATRPDSGTTGLPSVSGRRSDRGRPHQMRTIWYSLRVCRPLRSGLARAVGGHGTAPAAGGAVPGVGGSAGTQRPVGDCGAEGGCDCRSKGGAAGAGDEGGICGVQEGAAAAGGMRWAMAAATDEVAG